VKDFFKVIGGFVALWATSFLLFAWASLGFWPISTVRGYLAAKIDLAHGRYLELGYGMPAPEVDEYAHLLKGRYGIEFHRIAACTPTSSQISYAEAYDRISMEAAKHRFGRDVFTETYVEARKKSRQAHTELSTR